MMLMAADHAAAACSLLLIITYPALFVPLFAEHNIERHVPDGVIYNAGCSSQYSVNVRHQSQNEQLPLGVCEYLIF